MLNTPGFRAAGWVPTSGNATTTTQENGSLIKRTYSPPIPTTANVASEYYRFARHTELQDGDGLSIDDGEEDEGGMVTGGGGGSTYALGIKHHGRSPRKNRRRDRQVPVIQRAREGEDEDSSDLSDESDDEGDLTRSVLETTSAHKKNEGADYLSLQSGATNQILQDACAK